jgi:adenylate cyclase ExoY
VPEHAAQFSTIAQQNNQFILFRKVEKWATGLIKENFSTKDLHVKGKSSTWGPQAGFICCEQSLSKLHGSSAATVGDFNQKIRDSVEHGFAVEAPLVISKERLMSLAKLGALGSINAGTQGRWIVTAKQETFQLLPKALAEAEQKAVVNRFGTREGLWVFREVTVRGQVKDLKLVTVLANRMRLPLTADYDVFAICPHLSTAGYNGAGLPSGKARFRAAVGAVRTALGQADRRVIDTDLGRMTATQRRTKDLLNAAAIMAGYEGGNVVHHGTEVDNPVTELDFPVTVFVPGVSRGIYGAQNQMELENVVRDMLRAGYAFYGNRQWQNRSGTIVPGRSLEQSKMEREWDTSLDAGSVMTVLNRQDVA